MSFPPQREKIREKFVAALKKEFAGKGLRFTKGEKASSHPLINIIKLSLNLHARKLTLLGHTS